MSESRGLDALRAVMREHGGLLAGTVSEDPPEVAGDHADHAARAAAGPRVSAHRVDVELAVTAVQEGYELHYGTPRALAIDDPDLALLAGDRLYALGLARLSAIGDLDAIAELADLISLTAQARASDDLELAGAAWEAGATAIGWGTSPDLEAAKRRARAGDRQAATALRKAARAVSGAATT